MPVKLALVIIRSLGILAAVFILGAFTLIHITEPLPWSTILQQAPLYLTCLLLLIPCSRLTSSICWSVVFGFLSIGFASWVFHMPVVHSTPAEMAFILTLICSQIFVIVAGRMQKIQVRSSASD